MGRFLNGVVDGVDRSSVLLGGGGDCPADLNLGGGVGLLLRPLGCGLAIGVSRTALMEHQDVDRSNEARYSSEDAEPRPDRPHG